MNTISKLTGLILVMLAGLFAFCPGNTSAAFFAPLPQVAFNPKYDGSNQTTIGYDSTAESATGYDAAFVFDTDRAKNETTGDRFLFSKLAGFLAAEKGGPQFFRGAKAGQPVSFNPSSNEFKVDAGGFVRPTHGVSVFDNAGSVASKGYEPYEIDPASVPEGLKIIQRGGQKRVRLGLPRFLGQ